MDLCLREKNLVSAVSCAQKFPSFAFESDKVSYQNQVFFSKKYPIISLEFCDVLIITGYLDAIVFFSRIVIVGQHCHDNVSIFRSSICFFELLF